MPRDPYGRTTFRGVTLNWRTAEMLVMAEKKISYAPVELSQGSWSFASTSGGTHAGGGALDIRHSVRGRNLTRDELDEAQLELRRIGFAAWVRDPSQGNWPYHVHAIAIGDKDMSDAAAKQVVAYKNGRDGLKGNGPDYGPRPAWTQYPQELDELEMTEGEHDALIEIRDWVRSINKMSNDLTVDDPNDTISLETVLRLDRSRLYDTKTVVNDISKTVDDILEKVTVPPVPPV